MSADIWTLGGRFGPKQLHLFRVLIALNLVGILIGCASPESQSHAATRDNLTLLNKLFFAKDSPIINREREFYSDSQAIWPRTCLALSGGGIRSAAFSIGVMKALNIHGILNKLDVVSSVSGGSYALSWYVVQRAIYGHANDELFQRKGSLGADVSDGQTRLITTTGILPWMIGNIVLIPYNLFINGVFRAKANTTATMWYYEKRLSEVFHSDHWSGEHMPVTVTELGKKIAAEKKAGRERIPYFILNGAVRNRFVDTRESQQVFLPDTFEMTPLHIGNRKHSYDYDHPLDISLATTISGSAIDSAAQIKSEWLARVLSALNFDLVHNIENYNEPKLDEAKIWKWAPFPLHYIYFSILRPDVETDLGLTDGGHSENLGLFTLIRRRCAMIISVDAEHDPKYEYQSLALLHDELANNGRIPFDLDGVSWRKNQASVESCKPIRMGTIGPVPPDSSEGQAMQKLKLVYIKLRFDKTLAKKGFYGQNVADYFDDSIKKGRCNRSFGRNCFPQESTADQDFDPLQFNAYRDLGCRIVEAYLQVDYQNAGINISALAKPDESRRSKCFSKE